MIDFNRKKTNLIISSSENEKDKWLNDIKNAIETWKVNSDEQKIHYTATMKSNGNFIDLGESVFVEESLFV